jgi:hypothetical protein
VVSSAVTGGVVSVDESNGQQLARDRRRGEAVRTARRVWIADPAA